MFSVTKTKQTSNATLDHSVNLYARMNRTVRAAAPIHTAVMNKRILAVIIAATRPSWTNAVPAN